MYLRNCPICQKEITYKREPNFKIALKLDTKCNSCANRERMNRPEEILKNKKRTSGKNNPMFGKSIMERWIEKYGELEATLKYNEWISNQGKGSGMKGKTVYSIWLEKYGKEIADKKLIESNKKKSLNSKGPKNGMYGKPSPIGSGNGWSGWYNGWYFRSLNELSYMINVIERFNLKWISAETKKLKIEYKDYKGIDRTYSADFLINDKYLIECKPKKLWNSNTVKSKKDAAIEFCKKNNLIYKLVNCRKLTIKEIELLYNSKKIIFIERYDKKFKETSNSN